MTVLYGQFTDLYYIYEYHKTTMIHGLIILSRIREGATPNQSRARRETDPFQTASD